MVKEHIEGLSDPELIEYVLTGTELYEPEAVEFARLEVGRRNLSLGADDQVTVDAAQRVLDRRISEFRAASRPLGWGARILAVCFGWSIFGVVCVAWVIAWARMRKRGQTRKAADLWRFGFLGCSLMVGLVGLSLLPQRQYAVGGGVLVLAAIWAARILWAISRSDHAFRHSATRCMECGYDLRATSERCPECGTMVVAQLAAISRPDGGAANASD